MLRSLPINNVNVTMLSLKFDKVHVSIRGVMYGRVWSYRAVPLKKEDEPDQKGRDC